MLNESLVPLDAVIRAVRLSRRILIACDFDGTLCPLAASPWDVKVDPNMQQLLLRAAVTPCMQLAIISGRTLDDLERCLKLDSLFAGNHGLQIRGRGLDFEHPQARELRPPIRRLCQQLGLLLRPWPAAWIEDKGLSAAVHFREVEPDRQNELRRAVRRCVVGRHPAIALRAGKKVLELCPQLGWDKGQALTYIRTHTGPYDLCLCLGDDQTDEHMFLAEPGQINIKVGPGKFTRAHYRLEGPDDVRRLLGEVLDSVSPPPGRSHNTAAP